MGGWSSWAPGITSGSFSPSANDSAIESVISRPCVAAVRYASDSTTDVIQLWKATFHSKTYDGCQSNVGRVSGGLSRIYNIGEEIFNKHNDNLCTLCSYIYCLLSN